MSLDSAGSGSTILIVDDDAAIRKLIIAALKRDGHLFLEAGSGRKALESMGRDKIDLVVLDLMMPEMNGWELLEARALEPSLLAIPVIVISANREPEVADAMRHALHGYLPKPFELTALQALVRTALVSKGRAARTRPDPV